MFFSEQNEVLKIELYIKLQIPQTKFEVMINMVPIPFDSEDNFSAKILPAILIANSSMEAYIKTLDSATYEAVVRNQENLKTRADVEKFVDSLRR